MNLSSGYRLGTGLCRDFFGLGFSNGRLPFIAQGDAYTGVETLTGGPNANV